MRLLRLAGNDMEARSTNKHRGETCQCLHDVTIILKMLAVSYVYNISGNQVQMVAGDSFSVSYF
ncbi:MAG TPA: hypothetical protein G4O12_08355 [Dehalococcoidia bacterium]|nr:hypothetical protein [Dehalococcoidia bacterium]